LDHKTISQLDEFFGAFSAGAKPLLLLDYDGTLAPFRTDRFKARPWAGVRELLRSIHEQGRTRIVLITGRPAHEIVALLGIQPVPEVWGLHGAERLFPDGTREVDEPSATIRAMLEDLRAQLRRDTFGGLLEEKSNAVVMHWRGVAPRRAKAIEAKARALFKPVAQMDGLELLVFEAGIELRTGRDKGGAVKMLLDGLDDQVAHPMAYLGDDVTDEKAFEAINSHGLGVLVRRQWRETAAQIWLRPPEELREFLRRWLSACRAPGQD